MLDLTPIVLLMMAQPLSVPATVRFHVEDTARHIVVDLVCAARATTCRRVRTFEQERLEDTLAWVSLSALVDDVAASPLMDAHQNQAKTKRWRLRVGGRRNRQTSTPDDATDINALVEVLALDVPDRRPHPSADVSVVRFGGDPAARHDEAQVHCEPDAIWCSLSHLPAWSAGPIRHVRWPHIAWMGSEASGLMTADHLVLRPGEPNQMRWSWTLRVGDRTNPPGAVAELGREAFGMLSGLVKGR